jgi:spoIIIJ-associated protein
VSAAAPAEGDTEPAPKKRSRKRAAAEPAPTTASSPVEGDDEAESTEQGAPMTSISIEDQVEVIEDFLDGLMEAFDLDGEISTTEIDEETSEVRVEGDELGYLIGPKGQTLAAIHELCRTVAQRRLAGPHEGRIRLDIGGYRERRREALTRFATQVAEEVRSSGVEKALEPMSPPDRKVVHDTINEIDGVQTSSEGEEPRRRVVVSPVD